MRGWGFSLHGAFFGLSKLKKIKKLKKEKREKMG